MKHIIIMQRFHEGERSDDEATTASPQHRKGLTNNKSIDSDSISNDSGSEIESTSIVKSSRSWILQRASWREIRVLCRAIINTLASVGYLIGCVCWLIDEADIGTIIFASAGFAFFFTGIWWAISANLAFRDKYKDGLTLTEEPMLAPGLVTATAPPVYTVVDGHEIMRAFRSLTTFEILGAICQASGAIIFNIGCLTSFWGDEWIPETYSLWSLGSALFLLQGISSQVMCGSFWGPLLPIIPKYISMRRTGNMTPPRCCNKFCIHRCIPAACFNTLGSLLFVVGSISLCYETTSPQGGWEYCIGSALFVLANLGDILAFFDQLALSYWNRKATRVLNEPHHVSYQKKKTISLK